MCIERKLEMAKENKILVYFKNRVSTLAQKNDKLQIIET